MTRVIWCCIKAAAGLQLGYKSRRIPPAGLFHIFCVGLHCPLSDIFLFITKGHHTQPRIIYAVTIDNTQVIIFRSDLDLIFEFVVSRLKTQA